MATSMPTIKDESRRFPRRRFGVIFPRAVLRRRYLLLLLATLAPVRAGAAASKPAKAAPATAAALPSPKLDVKNWTLANGLNVLFLADHKAPIATVQVFYHVGSKDEHVGIRGVAHMFEHMMFKGSEHVPPEEHARLLKEVGGNVNAFTTEDLTAYHDTVPPSYVGFALELEAERMRHLKLFPGTVDSERRVVEEEKRLRVDNDPIGKAIEKFRLLAYAKHPYNWTPIGTIEDLEKVTPADCQRFYDSYYQPNNATLVVIGDVDEVTVRKLIEQHFGPIPKGPAPVRAAVDEPPQTALRAETLRVEVQVPVVVGGYHIPRAADPDVPALEVLAAVLSGGESSRLHQRLVRKEHLAIAAGGFAMAFEHPGLFLIYAAYLPDRDAARVQAVLAEEITAVRDKPITPAELDKAKNQLAAGFVFGLQTVDGIAQALGHAQYVEGDWKRFVEGATRYLAVTAADVERVAQKYLVDTNLTRVTLAQPAAGAATTK
jgi:zinc protease